MRINCIPLPLIQTWNPSSPTFYSDKLVASTGDPFSDDTFTALKHASRWNLASASPPNWYYHSWDNLHNYQLIYSQQYGVWDIRPALSL